jgi:hypothetical protein
LLEDGARQQLGRICSSRAGCHVVASRPSAISHSVVAVPNVGLIRRLLVIEARDLDTDERSRLELEVDAPGDEAGKRAQLLTTVSRVHPDAVLRSFGNDAASFLGPDHLVVAHYGQPLEHQPAAGGESPAGHEQQPLFAA